VQISSIDQTANPYATTQAPPPPPPGPGGPGGPQMDQSLATALGVSASDLQRARQSGESLSQFAAGKGISQDTLISAVKTTMAASAPQGAPALSDDQLTAMATDMIGRTPASGGHHHHGGGHVKLPDDSILSAISGTSPTDATSGTSITQILQQLLQSSADGSSTTPDGSSSDPSLQSLLDQLNGSATTTYGADGSTPGLSGSLGFDAAV
jgi:hypothetical protein